MLSKLSQAIALTISISLGIVGQAHAVSVISDQTSDVGDSLNTYGATDTQPSGTSLDSISGFLDSGDRDLYQIRLPVGTFTASTVGNTDLNTQLFLFDANGLGITANNDADGTTFASAISRTISSAGIYYLGISTEGVNPQSSGGEIFVIDSNTGGVADPASLASNSPLSSWSSSPIGAGDPEPYTITTTGAQITGPSTAVPFEFSPTYGLAILGMWAGCDYLRKRGWQDLKKE